MLYVEIVHLHKQFDSHHPFPTRTYSILLSMAFQCILTNVETYHFVFTFLLCELRCEFRLPFELRRMILIASSILEAQDDEERALVLHLSHQECIQRDLPQYIPRNVIPNIRMCATYDALQCLKRYVNMCGYPPIPVDELIKVDSFECLRWLLPRFDVYISREDMLLAIELDDSKCLDLILRHCHYYCRRFKSNREFVFAACKNKPAHLRLLLTHQFVALPNSYNIAIDNKNLENVKLLYEFGVAKSYTAHLRAAIVGDLEIYHWLFDHNFPRGTSNVCLEAVRNGHEDYLRTILCNDFQAHRDACTLAIEMNSERMLYDLVYFDAPKSNAACAAAVKVNRFDLIDNLLKFGFPKSENTCAYAVAKGNLDHVRHLISLGFPKKKSAYIAAIDLDRTDILDCLYTNNFPSGFGLYNLAATKGHIKSLRWLYENNISPRDFSSESCAAQNGHVDCLRYMLAHEYVAQTMKLVESAIMSDNTHCLDLLLEYDIQFNQEDRCYAERYEKRQSLQWLIKHGL